MPKKKDAGEQPHARSSDGGRLRAYQEKRNLRRSGEPSGRGRTSGTGSRASGTRVRPGTAGARRPGHGTRKHPVFVVQQHDASTLHYDLRIEASGVLKSWSVPKGPPADPADKRLAMPTEDHPLEYADFEGVIPEGEYGAGKVIVWDTGSYDNLTTGRSGDEIPVDDAIGRGHLTVRLHGEKLRGGYSLTRMGKGRRERWLLVKTADEAADPDSDPVTARPESVKSGKEVQQLTASSEPSASQ